ncbi:MAG: hypothetical protein AB8H79_19240 [Myxococcota bacterium]
MGRATFLPLVVLIACGTATSNSWQGDDDFSGGINAWYLDYPETSSTVLASAIDVQTDGFTVGTHTATVRMDSMTCGIHMDSGSMTFDVDLGEGEIQDGLEDSDLQITSLIVAPPLIAVMPDSSPSHTVRYLVEGLREARLLNDDAFVALAALDDGSCQISRYSDGHLDTTVDIDATCQGFVDMAVDRDSGQTWIAGPTGVYRIDGNRVTDLDLDGDLVAIDADSGALYVAQRGAKFITAIGPDGVLWTKTLPGVVVDIDDAGLPGGVVVAHEIGLASSVVRLQPDGVEHDHLVFDEHVMDIEVNEAGTAMAVARMTDHGYYRLR